MKNNKNEKDYAEYNHNNKTVRFAGKPAIVATVLAGVTLVGFTGTIIYITTRNPETTKEIAIKVIKEVTKCTA